MQWKLIPIYCCFILSAQERIGDWEAYTSPLKINNLIELNNRIISVTDGGLLIFDSSELTFTTLTNLDGLMGTVLSAIDADSQGNIWIGGANPDGFVQVYNLEQLKSVHEFNYQLSAVIDFAVSDSIIYAAYKKNQDWGIIEFIPVNNNYQFRDTYQNWPSVLNEIVGIEILGDSIFVGSDQGLFVGNWKHDNLKDPNSWTRPYSELNENITTIHRFEDILLIVKNGKYVYELNLTNGTPELIWDYFSNNSRNLDDLLKTADGTLYGIQSNYFIKLNDVSYDWQIRPKYKFSCLTELQDGTIVSGTQDGLAFAAFTDTLNRTFERYIPNAPLSNNFTAITLLRDGRLVAGSSKGLAIKEPMGWRNIIETAANDTIISNRRDYNYFIADTLPIDFGGFIADIEQGPDGLIYCAIRGTHPELWQNRRGGGIVIIDIDNPENYTIIDTAVLDYYADEYMVVKDIEFDQFGNLWAADAYAAAKHTPIQVRNTNGVWGSYVTNVGGILSPTPNTIAFDSWNRVWVGAFEASDENGNYPDGGLSMLSYSGDPVDPDDFQWTAVSINPDITTKSVWSISISEDNILYALTPEGLIYLELQSSVENPVYRLSSRSFFPNVAFVQGSKIRLDPRGNVWTLSPTNGIHVLLNNSTYWPDISGLTEENSFLLTDQVTDIAFDTKKGKAYITSNYGINILKIPFAEEKSNYKQIFVFPSPYHIPSTTPLVISELRDESSLQIITLNGSVIRTIDHVDLGEHGFQIEWDGKNKEGEWVGSGVYLIAVYNSRGENKFSKITVIRH